MNCHFVSRMLTRSWESSQRQLHVFDFASRRIRRFSSRSLFADDDLNSPAVEKWLSRMIEAPLGRAMPALLARDSKVLDDWALYRAAVLMLELQGLRSGEARSGGGDEPHSLADLAARPDSYVDQLVAVSREEFDFTTVFTPRSERLFFPSSGIFVVPADDSGCRTGVGFGVALPLSPRAVAVSVRKGADISEIMKAVVTLSAGIADHQSKLVIAPEVVSQYDEATLVPMIEQCRGNAINLMHLHAEKRRVVLGAYAEAGIRLELQRDGRFGLPSSAGVGL